jgi:hypothetical protein
MDVNAPKGDYEQEHREGQNRNKNELQSQAAPTQAGHANRFSYASI